MRLHSLGLALGLFSLGLATPGQGQTFDPDMYYQVQVRHAPGKCLDVSGTSTANLATMQQWDCNTVVPQPNQLWTFVPVGVGTYLIVSANSAKCLDIAGASTANGALVQQYNCNISTYQTNQVFRVTASPTAGYYRISATNNPGAPKCFDVVSSSTSNGAAVQQWDCGPYWNTNQDWQFVAWVDRKPLTHLTTFGYMGAIGNLSLVGDHVNTVVYSRLSPLDIDAARSTYGIKSTVVGLNDLFILDHSRSTPVACPAANFANIYSVNGSGGLRQNFKAYWDTNFKTPL